MIDIEIWELNNIRNVSLHNAPCSTQLDNHSWVRVVHGWDAERIALLVICRICGRTPLDILAMQTIV